MEKFDDVCGIVTINYGSIDDLARLFYSRGINVSKHDLSSLKFRKRGSKKCEVVFTPYSRNEDERHEQERERLLSVLKEKNLKLCTPWEALTLYPATSFELFDERTAFFQKLGGGPHSTLLLGVSINQNIFGEVPGYLWKDMGFHFCFQFIAPRNPTYLAGYREIK